METDAVMALHLSFPGLNSPPHPPATKKTLPPSNVLKSVPNPFQTPDTPSKPPQPTHKPSKQPKTRLKTPKIRRRGVGTRWQGGGRRWEGGRRRRWRVSLRVDRAPHHGAENLWETDALRPALCLPRAPAGHVVSARTKRRIRATKPRAVGIGRECRIACEAVESPS